MAAEVESFARKPAFSVITPVFDTPEPLLRAAIDSVLAQAYPHWELCIADDASSAPHVRRVLEEYRAKDARIKVAQRSATGNISAASNTALALATGDFVAFLDHDDELTPDALFHVAREVNRHPAAAMLYSDEDKRDFHGERTHPNFKPDWNYDLFLSHNVAAHLCVYRTDLVRRLGGFREGFEGAQDYDLALRAIEALEPREIRHIPRILYHWRMVPGSTAVTAFEKDYAARRAQRAIEEHLARRNIPASVEPIAILGAQRIRYRLPDPAPLVSIVVADSARARIDAEARLAGYPLWETVSMAGSGPRARNEAARRARGEVLVFLGADIEPVNAEWLAELVSNALRADAGAVAGKLWDRDGRILHAGTVLGAGRAHRGRRRGDSGYMMRADLAQSMSAVSGDCLAVRKTLFDAVGGFDEAFEGAFHDIDFCLRLRERGHRNEFTPFAEFRRVGAAETLPPCDAEAMARHAAEARILRARWPGVLDDDPHYNPNLSAAGEAFALAFPPRRR